MFSRSHRTQNVPQPKPIHIITNLFRECLQDFNYGLSLKTWQNIEGEGKVRWILWLWNNLNSCEFFKLLLASDIFSLALLFATFFLQKNYKYYIQFHWHLYATNSRFWLVTILLRKFKKKEMKMITNLQRRRKYIGAILSDKHTH